MRAASVGGAAAVIAVAVALAGCGDDDGGGARPPDAQRPAVVDMGRTFRTASGNTVTVKAFEPSVETPRPPLAGTVFTAAEVEACADDEVTENTGASNRLFFVETADGRGWPATASVREPGLRDTALGAGDCVVGWVTFQIPEEARPRFVILQGSSVAKWRIG